MNLKILTTGLVGLFLIGCSESSNTTSVNSSYSAQPSSKPKPAYHQQDESYHAPAPAKSQAVEGLDGQVINEGPYGAPDESQVEGFNGIQVMD